MGRAKKMSQKTYEDEGAGAGGFGNEMRCIGGRGWAMQV